MIPSLNEHLLESLSLLNSVRGICFKLRVSVITLSNKPEPALRSSAELSWRQYFVKKKHFNRHIIVHEEEQHIHICISNHVHSQFTWKHCDKQFTSTTKLKKSIISNTPSLVFFITLTLIGQPRTLVSRSPTTACTWPMPDLLQCMPVPVWLS